MKKQSPPARFWIPALWLAGLLLTACETIYSGTLILDEIHRFGPGETVLGDVMILGGAVALANGARVTGSIYMLDGELDLAGEVGGDVTFLGGTLRLAPEAHIAGDLELGNGRLQRSPEARIGGRVNPGTGLAPPLSPGWSESTGQRRLLWLGANTLLLAALAIPARRWIPRPLGRISRAATRHPVVAGALGLLAFVTGLVLAVSMAFTVILIPVALLGLLAGFVAIGLGWISLGAVTGVRISGWMGWRLSPGAQAALGTLVFMLALNLATLLPVAGGLAGILAAAVSLGAILLSRFGLVEYIPPPEEPDADPFEIVAEG